MHVCLTTGIECGQQAKLSCWDAVNPWEKLMLEAFREILFTFRHCQRAFSTVMGVEENLFIQELIIITEMVLVCIMFVMLISNASNLP